MDKIVELSDIFTRLEPKFERHMIKDAIRGGNISVFIELADEEETKIYVPPKFWRKLGGKVFDFRNTSLLSGASVRFSALMPYFAIEMSHLRNIIDNNAKPENSKFVYLKDMFKNFQIDNLDMQDAKYIYFEITEVFHFNANYVFKTYVKLDDVENFAGNERKSSETRGRKLKKVERDFWFEFIKQIYLRGQTFSQAQIQFEMREWSKNNELISEEFDEQYIDKLVEQAWQYAGIYKTERSKKQEPEINNGTVTV